MLVDDRRVNACLTLAVRPFIANAVSHATGRRVRELPITAEALL